MSVSLVWFKRDLRVSDNQALQEAVNSQLPVICLFNLESERIHRKDYPEPIIDEKSARKEGVSKSYSAKGNAKVKQRSKLVYDLHGSRRRR